VLPICYHEEQRNVSKFVFTAASLKAFHDANPQKIGWDKTQRGLGSYSSSSGAITLFCHFRIGSRQRKKAVGRLGEISISEARTLAAQYGVAGRHGRDLLEEQRQAQAKTVTLGDAYLAYQEGLRRRGASPNTLAQNAVQWRLRLAKHQSRAVATLTRAEVRGWHEGWQKAGAAAANNAARMLKTILNHAIKKLDVDIALNPATAIEFFPQRNRRGVLALCDLPAWSQAVATIQNPSHRAYWKLLLFTGLRRTDAASIKVVDIHADRIHRPSPKGGSAKAFDFPINVRPFGVSPHALRRTFASACIAAGVDFILTKALLNHSPNGDVTLTSYVKISLEQKLAAAERVASFIEGMLEGPA
jgi:integrase